MGAQQKKVSCLRCWGKDPEELSRLIRIFLPSLATDTTILIAEDNDFEICRFLRALRTVRRHCLIHVVGDSEQVISYLSNNPPYDNRTRFPTPDLVLLGSKMPNLDAGRVLSWIKTEPALDGLQVVLFSGSNLERDFLKAKELGAKDYRVRPTTPWGMAQTVRELTSKWLA